MCSTFSGLAANAQGRFRIETEGGARCEYTHDRRPEITVEANSNGMAGGDRYDWGYGSRNESGFSAGVALRIPIGGDRIKGAAEECRAMGKEDNNRAQVRFLLELYQDGMATAEDVEAKARSLGVPLTLEPIEEGGGMTAIIKGVTE